VPARTKKKKIGKKWFNSKNTSKLKNQVELSVLLSVLKEEISSILSNTTTSKDNSATIKITQHFSTFEFHLKKPKTWMIIFQNWLSNIKYKVKMLRTLSSFSFSATKNLYLETSL